ncbi:hypothetical protein [Pararhizobium sp. PWRC1-1]|uniref:hypothetical protein n=1 Tax=Pararhizobium sp. PWRC1-1 TaxID=2804566 RepID=UPI003CE6F168
MKAFHGDAGIVLADEGFDLCFDFGDAPVELGNMILDIGGDHGAAGCFEPVLFSWTRMATRSVQGPIYPFFP